MNKRYIRVEQYLGNAWIVLNDMEVHDGISEDDVDMAISELEDIVIKGITISSAAMDGSRVMVNISSGPIRISSVVKEVK